MWPWRGIPAAPKPTLDTSGHARPHSVFHHIKLISSVSGEIFVASVSPKRNRYVFPGYTGHIIGWNRRGIRKRLVVMPREFIHNSQCVRLNDLLVVLRMELFRDLPCILILVELGHVKTNRTGGHWLIHQPRHGSHHRRRIEA